MYLTVTAAGSLLLSNWRVVIPDIL
jgi:hypothetical protein